MAALKNGTPVRFVPPPLEGVIVGGAFIDGEPQYCVEYVDAQGETQQRYFLAEQLSLISA